MADRIWSHAEPALYLVDADGNPTLQVEGLVPPWMWTNTAGGAIPTARITVDMLTDPKSSSLLDGLTEVCWTIDGERQANSHMLVTGSSWVLFDDRGVGRFKQFTLASLFWRFARTPLLAVGPDARERELSGPAFQVLVAEWNRWKAAGWLEGIDKDWTGSLDSRGEAASSVLLNRRVKPGSITFYGLLEHGRQRGAWDYRMRGHLLRVFNYGTSGDDFSAPGEGQITLEASPDLVDGARVMETDTVANDVTVYGGDNRLAHREDTASIAARGRVGRVFNTNATSDQDVLDEVAQRLLDAAPAPIAHKTYKSIIEPNSISASAHPYKQGSFTVYDKVAIVDGVSAQQPYTGTIAGIILAGNGGPTEVTVEIDTRRQTHESQVEQIVDELLADGDGAPPTKSWIAPAAPNVTSVVASLYPPPGGTGGKRLVRIALDWDPVTLDTDGQPCTDLRDYLIQWRYTGSRGWGHQREVSGNESQGFVDGIEPGRQIDLRMGARDTDNLVTFTAELGLT